MSNIERELFKEEIINVYYNIECLENKGNKSLGENKVGFVDHENKILCENNVDFVDSENKSLCEVQCEIIESFEIKKIKSLRENKVRCALKVTGLMEIVYVRRIL